MIGKSAVQAVLDDVSTADIGEPLRATLTLLRKVTRDHATVTAADIAPLIAAGVTRAQIEDALEVAFAFNVVTRLADTFGFEIGPESAFEASARQLLKRGYLM